MPGARRFSGEEEEVNAIAGNARYETGSDSNAFTFSRISPLRDISPLLSVFAKMSARITHPRAKGGAIAEAAIVAHALSFSLLFSPKEWVKRSSFFRKSPGK